VTAPDKSVDWVICKRVLTGHGAERDLTFAEIAVVYQAVLAGGGNQQNVIELLNLNHALVKTVREHVGVVTGFPVVDGIRLVWCETNTSSRGRSACVSHAGL
jgi:hypothetical protein